MERRPNAQLNHALKAVCSVKEEFFPSDTHEMVVELP